MKNFDEACEAVLIRRVPEDGNLELPQDLQESSIRYRELIAEVENSELTAYVVMGYVTMMGMQPLTNLMAGLFAQGVMVGCEMWKEDELVGGISEQ